MTSITNPTTWDSKGFTYRLQGSNGHDGTARFTLTAQAIRGVQVPIAENVDWPTAWKLVAERQPDPHTAPSAAWIEGTLRHALRGVR